MVDAETGQLLVSAGSLCLGPSCHMPRALAGARQGLEMGQRSRGQGGAPSPSLALSSCSILLPVPGDLYSRSQGPGPPRLQQLGLARARGGVARLPQPRSAEQQVEFQDRPWASSHRPDLSSRDGTGPPQSPGLRPHMGANSLDMATYGLCCG